MTTALRDAQEVLADQFRLTSTLSALTGEYLRLLQKQAAAAFARQMAEDGPPQALTEAEQVESSARHAASRCEMEVQALERQLLALGTELAALAPGAAR